MKMGELEQRTGVNRETIRVLIRKGLVPPADKPRATVAYYNEEHVQAIRAVRSLQYEHQVTLDEIGAMLRGDYLLKRVEAPAFQQLEKLVAARFGEDDRKIPLSTLLQTNPHADRDARGLAALGAVDLIETDEGAAVSYTDASLIGLWARMRAIGFEESANFYPEVLDHYTRAADYLAHAEATRFLARAEGVIDEDRAADMLKVGLPLMLDFFGVLRMRYFMRYIAAANSGTANAGPPQLPRAHAADLGPKPAESRRSPTRGTQRR